MSPRKPFLQSIAVWIICLGASVQAQIAGFGVTGANWTLNVAQGSGSTPTIQSNVLQLVNSTQSGTSAFFDTPQYIGSFTASFVWQNVQASAGAGFTFCLQNQGVNAVGQVGGNYLGFYQLSQATGVAFNVLSSGSVNPGVGYAPLTVPDGGSIGYTPTGSVNFDASNPILVQLAYTNNVLDITVTDTVTTNTFTTNFAANLSTAVGGTTAFVGFTGGGVENLQVVISNFVFTPIIPPTHQGTFPVTFTNGAGNIDVSKIRGNETDPSIVYSPSSNSQMFVAANAATALGLFGSYSHNGGTNWTTANLANLPSGSYPVVAWDGYSNLFMAYADGNFSGIDVAYSINGGLTFTFLTNLATGDFAVEPKIAVGQGAALGSVWVLYKDYSLANAPLVAQGAEVTNTSGFGAFGPAELIPGSDNVCGFGDIAVGPQGQVMVVYQTLHDSPGMANDFVSVDADGLGPNFFAPAVLAATNVLGGNTILPAASNGQGINGASALAWDLDLTSQNFGKVYLIAAGQGPTGGNDTDIFLSTSTDSGATWSSQARINDNANHNSEFMPRVAVDQSTGILAMSWYDCRLDLGWLFVTNISITNVPNTNSSTNSDGSYSQTNTITNVTVITNFSGTVDRASNDDTEIYATLSLDGGVTIQPNVNLTSDTTNGYEAALAVNPTDFGNYTGLTFCQGVFYPVWADNSGSHGQNPDGATNNFDIVVAPTILKGLADISVTQVVTNTTNLPAVGSLINYFITVSNAGPTAVTAAVLTDNFPTNVNVILAFPTNNGVRGTYVVHNNVLTWTVGALGVAKAATILVRTTAAQIGNALNVATVSPGNGVTDLFTNNNVSVNNLTIYGADMNLTLTSTPAVIGYGGPGVTYSMTVSNQGPVTATGVVISNTLPLGFVPTGYSLPPGVTSNTGPNPNNVSIAIGTMTNGQSVSFSLTAQYPIGPVPNPIVFYATNTAVVTGIIDPSATNNVAQAVTLVNPPDVAVGITASPSTVTVGQQMVFRVTVANLGPVEADEVVVTNILPAYLTLTGANLPGGATMNASGNVYQFVIGTLANGQILSFTFTAVGNSLGSGIDVITISDSQPDPSLANNSVALLTPVVGPDMAVGVRGSPASVPVGQTVNYTINVTNLGPVNGTGVVVTNILQSNLALAGVSLPLGMTYTTNLPDTVVFNIGAMANGQVVTVGVTALATGIGKGTNLVYVADSLYDSNPANNSAKAVTTITSGASQFSGVTVIPGVTSAFITWNTASNSTSQVDYGLTNTGGVSYLNPTPTNHHVVLLTGLLPDSTYSFQVRSVTPAVPPSDLTNGQVVTILNGGPSVLYVTNGTFTTTSTLIFGTADAGYSGVGWTAGANATGIFTGPNNNEPYYNYVQGVSGSPTASATYVPNIPVPGLYDISVWYPNNPGGFASSTPMIANGTTNALLVNVNQTNGGGGWNQIVTGLYFANGTGGNLTIYNNAGNQGGSVAANGARWVYETSQDAATNGSVPAWWSSFYFGHAVNGSDDTDGDGYSNYAEFVLGTDPTSAASGLQFQVTPTSSNNVAVNFAPWQGGRLYQLQSSPALVNPTWVTLTNTPVQNTNDGTGTFTVRQSGTNTFYRLSATLLPNQ
jgi:uncharacterized repeat protein (TIGR01451 family)